MNVETDHAWAREQMATSLADGLSGDERSRFDAHLAACETCAAEYAALRDAEQRLTSLFAEARPPAGFEDRLIRSLRETRQRRTWIHPMVRRAAVGVAATLLLASAGYVVTSASNGGRLPDLLAISNRVKDASNLKQIGLAILQYSNENKRGYFDYDVYTAPSSNAEKDTYGGGTNAAVSKSNFTDLLKNLSYSYQEPYPNANAAGAGFKLNNSISAEFAVGGDINRAAAGEVRNQQRRPSPEQGGRAVTDLTRHAKDLVNQTRYAEALGVVDQILTIDPKNNYAAGVRPLVEDKAVLAEQRRFRESKERNVSKPLPTAEKKPAYDDILKYPTNWPDISERRDQKTSDATAAGGGTNSTDSVKGSRDGDDSVLRPTESFGVNVSDGSGSARQNNGRPANAQAANVPSDAPAAGARWDADSDVKLGKSVQMLPQVVPFKPADLAAGQSERGTKLTAGVALGETVRGWPAQQGQTQAGVAGAVANGGAPQFNLQTAPTGGQSAGEQVQDLLGGLAVAGGAVETGQPAATQPASGRKIIRTANMEFEVDRFDAALAMITKLTQEAGGYIGTTDSEKLPNGKVKGSVTVRVPPDRLDTLVLQLRGIGDLRSQKMDAQDVTKQYTDLEGEYRAARAMEERLLEIIKTGKGEIKDLLAAEKELGVWRTKIEKFMGEMKYYDNLVALTTLTITAIERDIRTAAIAKETETVDAGIETDDVETARAAALKAIDEAKGRVIQSDLKRHDAGQFAAQVVADVPADGAGPLIDRLKQLGKVARFEVQRRQTTPEGTQPAPGVRLERAETRVNLSLYNLANVAPRQTTNLNLAAADVEAAHKAIVARVEKAGGRVVTSNLSRPKADQVVGAINFEVKSGEAEAVLSDVRAAGEVMRLTVTENPDTSNVTTAKQGFVVQLASVAAVPPRESTNLQVAATEVPVAYAALRDAAQVASARVTTSQLNEAQRENVTAILDFEVMRDALPAVEEAIKKLGDVTQRTSGRSADTENTVDSKVRLQVSFVDADQLPPRETTALGVEVADPDKAIADLQADALAAGGRVIQSNLSQERGGQTIGKLIVDVPLAKSVELITRAKAKGGVRMVNASKDASVPDGSLARARIDLTFADSAGIVAPDQGVWASIRRGLAASMTGLMWSLQLIVIGLCFVGPWVLLIVLGWKLLRRKKPPASAPAV